MRVRTPQLVLFPPVLLAHPQLTDLATRLYCVLPCNIYVLCLLCCPALCAAPGLNEFIHTFKPQWDDWAGGRWTVM